VLMYALLPQQTQPGQQVVPPLPASASDPTTAFLTIFIVMTMVGAPITLAIGLALIARWVSRQVPSSSAAAEAVAAKSAGAKAAAQVPTSTSGAIKPSAAPDVPKAPKALSAKEEVFWKIAAAGLSLILIGGLTAIFWNDIVRMFNPY
jgi:hypothetical protein